MSALTSIDCHVEGQAVRLVTAGVPSPHGNTMSDKIDWLAIHEDRTRRTLVLEPRGHLDLIAAMFTEAVARDSHAGLIFMNHAGFSALPAASVMGAAVIGLSRGLVVPGGDGRSMVCDTMIGPVQATCDGQAHPNGVWVTPPPAFVLHAGITLTIVGRRVRADVAYGGGCFALVDAESAGVGTSATRVHDLRRTGELIAAAIDDILDVQHPLDPARRGIDGTIFTAPPSVPGADLRCVVVSSDGQVDRSPGGVALASLMAVLDAMSVTDEARPFRVEGLAGTVMPARIASRTIIGEYPAVIVDVGGSAWITGEHAFLIEAGDPLADGLEIGTSGVTRSEGTRG